MKTFTKLTCLTVLLSYQISISQQKNIDVGSSLFDDAIEQRYAFIIGNDHYIDANINSLASCRLDAERFHHFITSDTGLKLSEENTRIILDGARQEIISSFIQFLDNIKNPKASALYFYYSGHGIQGGILPVDFSIINPELSLGYDWLRQEILKRQINMQLFVIDACYSGSMITNKAVMEEKFNYFETLNEVEKDKNTVIFTATSAYRITPAGRHASVYTKHFLKAARAANTDTNTDGVITTGELYVAIQKALQTSNSPQFFGNDSYAIALSKLNTQNKPNYKKLETNNTLIVTWRDQIQKNEKNTKYTIDQLTTFQNSSLMKDKVKLGFMFREGIGISQDYNTAIQYFILGALEEDPFAIYNLGYMYFFGKGVEKDIDKAIVLYKRAALLDDPFAQYNLGCILFPKSSNKVIANEKLAIEYFRKSSKNEFTPAIIKLANIYLTKSKKKNKRIYLTIALQYLEKAAQKNNIAAQYKLAMLYEKGKDVQQNKIKANFWFKEACKNNHLISCKKLMAIAAN